MITFVRYISGLYLFVRESNKPLEDISREELSQTTASYFRVLGESGWAYLLIIINSLRMSMHFGQIQLTSLNFYQNQPHLLNLHNVVTFDYLFETGSYWAALAGLGLMM